MARLHADSWRHAYRGMLSDAYLDGDILAERQEIWLARLASPAVEQLIVVAELDHTIVGLACAFGAHDPAWGTLLENLHVAGQHKRQGIGRALLQHVQEWSGNRYPGAGMHLWVLADNTPAQHFYRRLRAQPVETSTWHAPDGSRLAQHRYTWSNSPNSTQP